jgi:superfamily II DNA/RNA helicase
MKDVFDFRNRLIDEYAAFSRSFSRIAAPDLAAHIDEEYGRGRYWPEPLIQINPNYKRDGTVQKLVKDGSLHSACAALFQAGKVEGKPADLHLYKHQMQAIAKAQNLQSYVVTTGTGSGKSLSFFIPVIDRILKAKQADPTPRTRAIVIYPMNALANSQLEELDKFLHGYPSGQEPFSVRRYTGQESSDERKAIADNPPDILLTNFMMLELILTRFEDIDRRVVDHCRGLEFLVLDELHTYRGRQGADVAMLVRRIRERMQTENLVCIGTSATMSSADREDDRNQTVANVASLLFGAQISALDVIGETLERVTNPARDVAAVKPLLKAALAKPAHAWGDFDTFRDDPLAIWVELNLGIDLPKDQPPRRAKPIALKEAATRLATDAGCEFDLALEGLRRFLVAAHDMRTPQGRAPFAFKLHQFISGPGKVLATLEPVGQRHITLDAQRFAPGRQTEGTQLYPVHFCRDCGQEYHPVWRSGKGAPIFDPREIDDISSEDDEDARYGFLCPTRPGLIYTGWEDVPDSWIDLSTSEAKVKPSYKNAVPEAVTVTPQGQTGPGGAYWYIPGKFRFCMSCGLTHEAYGKDMNRLASLSGEGRSSATTMLTLSAVRQLFELGDPQADQPDPRKLLGFTDNRQDAALQAGHFNDFIFLLTLRSALVAALQKQGGVLTEEHLADAVFKALGFDRNDAGTLAEYLKTPKLMGLARQEAQRTLRYILGYRLLRDLRRGWRFNNPNLDQLNLLAITYRGLDDFSQQAELFSQNPALGSMTPAQRSTLAETVFSGMRRALCLQTRYLDAVEQERAKTTAFQYLNERWTFGDENLETARWLILSKRPDDKKGKPRADLVPGGARSRLLKEVKTLTLWKSPNLLGTVKGWKDAQWVELLQVLLVGASHYGYVQRQEVESQLIGWRLNASAMDWMLVDTPEAEQEGKHNRFFRQLYLSVAATLNQQSHALFELEAQEHTAQVDAGRRQLLEQRFRFTEKDRKDWLENPAHEAPLERLPVMFCSPTMELGVDISALNTVYLRNVPPTPANYAQRSGRAGRSGQQALVIAYCAALSPHDQWFFHHATEMVHGVVRPPTLDLANRDLIDSHLHAVWLSAAQVQLDTSIAPLLDLEKPDKPLVPALRSALEASEVTARATQSAERLMHQVRPLLANSGWFTEAHVPNTMQQAAAEFSASFGRWRVMVDATRKQMDMADQVVKSYTTTHTEKQNAQRRYGDAARQYAVLLKSGNTQSSDFYTYRYLASQGFLPGYNFPRLPLMAWIPARGGTQVKGKEDEGSMVSRPRFLALSEFGPRSLIYHQGRMYRVVRAKLNVGSADHVSGNTTLATISSRVCSQCGYAHMGGEDGSEPTENLCENCGALLTDHDWVRNLYRIETVETVPVERISINDEDRQRQGFELQTTYRYLPGPEGRISLQTSLVLDVESKDESPLASLKYAPAAQIWRINRGWRRRKNKEQLGFYINPITGQWSRKDEPGATEDPREPSEELLDKVPNQPIVPFVEDHRNVLILAPVRPLEAAAMATLQAALKRAIELVFQIEESELVAEPLPTQSDRKALLFYEAAEGGAGVLTRLATEPDALALVASQALELMHHNRPNGAWTVEALPDLEVKRKDGSSICEAGCYQCLLSYFNQPDHEHINRRDPAALGLLVALANARVVPQTESTPAEALSIVQYSSAAGDLQGQWLATLLAAGCRPPEEGPLLVLGGRAQVAARYKSSRTLVALQALPAEVVAELADLGWTVLDMSNPSLWAQQFATHANLFN